MTESSRPDSDSGTAPPAGDAAQEQRLLRDVGELGTRMSELAREGAALLHAESRLFVQASMWILVLLVCAGLLLAAALIALLLASLVVLVEGGWLSWTWAPLLAALVLLVAVFLLLLLVRWFGRDLGFPRSRQLLRPADTQRAKQ